MTLRIDVERLQLRYGETVALDDLSFTLEGDKIVGLLGRNGSGKTSLLSVLAAFRRASSGRVLIDGQEVFENPAITERICLIREGGDVQMDEKVKEALAFAAYMRPNWDADYAGALLERLQVSLNKKVGDLSRGQQSSLGVTLGLATRAPLTMFDESYLGMDAPSRYTFYDALLADFMEHPRTFVISTHLIEEVANLFEEVVIIDHGKLLLQDDAEALRSRGAAVTGPSDAVDRFVDGLTVLNERQLGGTKSAMVYGGLENGRLEQARAAGLELGPIALQDLFVHLTERGEVLR
jgi:ABC-2 type transport system ATP-binding protein